MVHQHGKNPANIEVERQSIPSFNVLCIKNSPDINIIQGDTSFIEFSWLKDSLFQQVNYSISDDTLIISDLKLLKNGTSVKICSTSSLKKIELNNAEVSIEHFRSGNLSFDLDESIVWINKDTIDKSPLQTLDIIARNHSRFEANEFNVDTIVISLQSSIANLSINVDMVSGTLSDSSSLFTRQPCEIYLKKDTSSSINLSDY